MKCHTCLHPEREAIDRALVAAEPPRRVLAARYGISKSSLGDHMKNHLTPTLRSAVARTTREDSLANSFAELVTDAKRIQRTAESRRDLPTALAAVRELARLFELAVAHKPTPIEQKQPKVRLVFTQRGKLETVVGEEPPPIETTAVEVRPTQPTESTEAAEETEPAAVPPRAEPRRPEPPAPAPKPIDPHLGGFPIARRTAPPADYYSREERDRRARRAEERQDAEDDARRRSDRNRWGPF